MLVLIWSLCFLRFFLISGATSAVLGSESPGNVGGIRTYSFHGNVTEVSTSSDAVIKFQEVNSGNIVTITKNAVRLEPLKVFILVTETNGLFVSKDAGDTFDLIGINARGKVYLGKDCYSANLTKLCILFPSKTSDLSLLQSSAFLIMTGATERIPIPQGAMICYLQLFPINDVSTLEDSSFPPVKRPKLDHPVTKWSSGINLVPIIDPPYQGRIICDSGLMYKFSFYFVRGHLRPPYPSSSDQVLIYEGLRKIVLGPTSVHVSEPPLQLHLSPDTGRIYVDRAMAQPSNSIILSVNWCAQSFTVINDAYAASSRERICIGLSDDPSLLNAMPQMVMDFIRKANSLPHLPDGSLLLCVQVLKKIERRERTPGSIKDANLSADCESEDTDSGSFSPVTPIQFSTLGTYNCNAENSNRDQALSEASSNRVVDSHLYLPEIPGEPLEEPSLTETSMILTLTSKTLSERKNMYNTADNEASYEAQGPSEMLKLPPVSLRTPKNNLSRFRLPPFPSKAMKFHTSIIRHSCDMFFGPVVGYGYIKENQFVSGKKIFVEDGVNKIYATEDTISIASQGLEIKLDQRSKSVLLNPTIAKSPYVAALALFKRQKAYQSVDLVHGFVPASRTHLCLALSSETEGVSLLKEIAPLLLGGNDLPEIPYGSLLLCAQIIKQKRQNSSPPSSPPTGAPVNSVGLCGSPSEPTGDNDSLPTSEDTLHLVSYPENHELPVQPSDGDANAVHEAEDTGFPLEDWKSYLADNFPEWDQQ